MSDADRVQMSYALESTFGTAPTGAYEIFKITSESLRQDTTITPSLLIRSDRQTATVVRTNLSGAGTVNSELHYGEFDDFFEYGILADTSWSTAATPVTATDIDAADGDNSLNSGASAFTGFTAGEWIFVSGFAAANNNGFFKLTSATTAKLVIDGVALTTEAVGPSVTVTEAASITNGTKLQTTTIEKQYADLTNIFSLHHGMAIDSFGVSVSTDGIVSVNFDFVGKDETSATASPGSSYNAADTTIPMNSVDDVNKILENDAILASTNYSFTLSNNLRARQEIGTLGAISIGTGNIDVTGAVQGYFTAHAVMDKYLNQTLTSNAVGFKDAAGNGYVFDFPEVKYTTGQRVVTGQNSDIIQDMAFQAFMDPEDTETIRISRFTGI